jgi:hypothetical protein
MEQILHQLGHVITFHKDCSWKSTTITLFKICLQSQLNYSFTLFFTTRFGPYGSSLGGIQHEWSFQRAVNTAILLMWAYIQHKYKALVQRQDVQSADRSFKICTRGTFFSFHFLLYSFFFTPFFIIYIYIYIYILLSLWHNLILTFW